MATYITTNADLTSRYPVIASEIERLTTPEMAASAGPPVVLAWVALHTAAWRAILRDLGRRRPAIAEADLTDTTQFVDASLYYVLYLAYMNAETDAARHASSDWLKRYEREMAELTIEVDGAETEPEASCVRLFRG